MKMTSSFNRSFTGILRFFQPTCLAAFSLLLLLPALLPQRLSAQSDNGSVTYTLSMPHPEQHLFVVELEGRGWKGDSLRWRMPQWSPGYYQIMSYAEQVRDLQARDGKNKPLPLRKTDSHSWQIKLPADGHFFLRYAVQATRQFVANSYLDSSHGYVVPASIFLYPEGHLKKSIRLFLRLPETWKQIATGLDPLPGKKNAFEAPDFDVFYDCPLLMGPLQSLPSFRVKGIEHRFIGYRLSAFDENAFMNNLQKVVEAAVNLIGDIPYHQYTFIGIGPGRGGIEHLNSTTVSFDGRGLETQEGMIRSMTFLAHEYFHHYNVKRIRPFELGPFDYDRPNRTNLLWVSEGLSVYYEYLLVKRAGLIGEKDLLNLFSHSLNAYEQSAGREVQSLQQASYQTWSEGPFGTQDSTAPKTISYYDKGPVVGLILDLAIRHYSGQQHSLDDVMRYLYYHYYKELQRGFTDAEFQEACEQMAGRSLNAEFEYVYTAKPLDLDKYLAYAGLQTEQTTDDGKAALRIVKKEENQDNAQSLLKSWYSGQ